LYNLQWIFNVDEGCFGSRSGDSRRGCNFDSHRHRHGIRCAVVIVDRNSADLGVFNRRISGEVAPSPHLESDPQPDEDDADARDRALAAALAVTALRASQPQTSLTTGEDG